MGREETIGVGYTRGKSGGLPCHRPEVMTNATQEEWWMWLGYAFATHTLPEDKEKT